MLLTRKNTYGDGSRTADMAKALENIMNREQALVDEVKSTRNEKNKFPEDATKLDFDKVKYDVLAKRIANYLSKNFCLGKNVNRFDTETIRSNDEDILYIENKIKFPMGYDVTSYIISQLRTAEKYRKDETKRGKSIDSDWRDTGKDRDSGKRKESVLSGDVKFERYVSGGMIRCNRLVDVMLGILNKCAVSRSAAAFSASVSTDEPIEIGGVKSNRSFDPYGSINSRLDGILSETVGFLEELYSTRIYPIQKNITIAKNNIFNKFRNIEDAVILGTETFRNAADFATKVDRSAVPDENRLVNDISKGGYNLSDRDIEKIKLSVDAARDKIEKEMEAVEAEMKEMLQSFVVAAKNDLVKKLPDTDENDILKKLSRMDAIPSAAKIVGSRVNNTRGFVDDLGKITTLLDRYHMENQTKPVYRAAPTKETAESDAVYVPASKLSGVFECIRNDCFQYRIRKKIPRDRLLFYKDDESKWWAMVKRDENDIYISLKDLSGVRIDKLETEFMADDEEWYRILARMFVDNYVLSGKDPKGWVAKKDGTGYKFSLRNLHRFYDFINQKMGGMVNVDFSGQIKFTDAKDILGVAKTSGKDYDVTIGPDNIKYILGTMYEETFNRLCGLMKNQTKLRFPELYGVFSRYGEA